MAKLFYRLCPFVNIKDDGINIDIPDHLLVDETNEEKIKESISYRVVQSLISQNVIDFVKYIDEEAGINVSIDANSLPIQL